VVYSKGKDWTSGKGLFALAFMLSMPRKSGKTFGISASVQLDSSDSWIWLGIFNAVPNAIERLSSNSPCDPAKFQACVNMLCLSDVNATGDFLIWCNNQQD